MKNLAIGLLCLAAAAAGQQQDPPFRLPDGVDLKPDLVYASPGGRDLRLDLYAPASGAGPFPAVVYIHGGGWSGGNKKAFSRQAAHMAANGFIGACIQYRLSGEAKYPAAFDDAKAAVAWMRANAAKYRLDASRIGAAGGSAGGHLVAMLGMADLGIKAVAAFNPAVDLVTGGKRNPDARSGPIYSFLGYTYAERPQVWEEASPSLHVTRGAPPFLFLHGMADMTVPYQQSVEMMKKLQAAGVRAELYSAEGAGHGFFNRPPYFEPALKRMEEFFTKTLR